MSEKAHLCTVIMPYYNTDPAVFRRCMQSFQSLPPEAQLLIIDDGSDQPHAAFADTFARENVRILHQKNGGVSAARNTGLQQAEGKYILFADSDDCIKDGFVQNLCRQADAYRAEVLIADITIMPDNRTERTGYPKGTVLPGRDLAAKNPRLFAGFDLCYSVRMCFDRAFLQKNRLRFREDMTISEDMVFNMQALALTQRAVAIGESYYEYWLDTPDSATRAPYKPGYFDSLEKEYEVCKAFTGENEALQVQLAAFYMDFAFYELVRNEKAGECLGYERYRALCESPMFRESILLLGKDHPCENQKAQLLYRLRHARQYRLPYVAAIK